MAEVDEADSIDGGEEEENSATQDNRACSDDEMKNKRASSVGKKDRRA